MTTEELQQGGSAREGTAGVLEIRLRRYQSPRCCFVGIGISVECDIQNVDGDQKRLGNFLLIGVRYVNLAFRCFNDSVDGEILSG